MNIIPSQSNLAEMTLKSPELDSIPPLDLMNP